MTARLDKTVFAVAWSHFLLNCSPWLHEWGRTCGRALEIVFHILFALKNQRYIQHTHQIRGQSLLIGSILWQQNHSKVYTTAALKHSEVICYNKWLTSFLDRLVHLHMEQIQKHNVLHAILWRIMVGHNTGRKCDAVPSTVSFQWRNCRAGSSKVPFQWRKPDAGPSRSLPVESTTAHITLLGMILFNRQASLPV